LNLLTMGMVADAGSADQAIDWMDPRYWGAFIQASLAGQTVTAATAAQLDVVQSVLERLGGTASSLPIMLFRRLPDGSREPAKDHPVYSVLHRRPNGRQTPQEFHEQMIRSLAFYRNALAVIHPADDGYPIGELEWIDWGRVARVWTQGARTYYEVMLPSGTVGASVTYNSEEVVHIRKAPLTMDGLCGVPMYVTGRETMGVALAVRQFGALYFANGGSGGGIIEMPGKFADEDAKRQFIETWRSAGSGMNRHKDRILLGGAQYKPLTIRNDEAQFNETKNNTAIDVARLWNMPPHMIGLLDKATFGSIEQMSIEFVQLVLAPWITAYEQALERDLLMPYERDEYFVEINVAGLLRGDQKTRFAGYAQGRQWGWLSVNDIRRLENMPPIGDEGDIYLQPVNMSPAGTPEADDDVAAKPTPDNRDPADNNDDPED
jgi:HK97 family phage portal protein